MLNFVPRSFCHITHKADITLVGPVVLVYCTSLAHSWRRKSMEKMESYPLNLGRVSAKRDLYLASSGREEWG
jgi:hypothetical protein